MPYTWLDVLFDGAGFTASSFGWKTNVQSSVQIYLPRYRADGSGANGAAHPVSFWRNYWFSDYCGSDSTKSARRFAGLNQQAETETEGPGELTGAPGLLDFDHNRDPR